MNIDRINTTLALTANIGVLIGIFVIVLELRQNQASLDAFIQLSLSSAFQEIQSRPTENRDFATVLYKGFVDPDDLDMVDTIQIVNWIQEHLSVLYATYEPRNEGIISEEVWALNARYFALMLETPSVRELYENYSRFVYPEEFFLALESHISD